MQLQHNSKALLLHFDTRPVGAQRAPQCSVSISSHNELWDMSNVTLQRALTAHPDYEGKKTK